MVLVGLSDAPDGRMMHSPCGGHKALNGQVLRPSYLLANPVLSVDPSPVHMLR
jgi:hypothetical protein